MNSFLDWSLQSIDFQCPVCNRVGTKQGVVKCDGHNLYRCSSCACLIYHPLPKPDYTSHTAGELSFRDYVEENAGVDIHCRQVDALIDKDKGRILDIGCGFGFGLDYARRIFGWEAVGYEPSTYGEKGREQLGVDIRPEFASFNAGDQEKFDVVYCSEVIEHVEDPQQFIHLLASHLKKDGTLFMTTPNPEAITRDNALAETLALLCAGFHTMLLSSQAITGMLRIIGFNQISVDASGSSLRITATRTIKSSEVKRGFDQRYRRYLSEVLSETSDESPLHIGLTYRLYRSFGDEGDWSSAAAVLDQKLISNDLDLHGVDNFEAFAARFPLCVAPLTYYRAMQAMNGNADYDAAARLFRSAHALCAKKLEINPSASVIEEDLLWWSAFHEGLAYVYGGKNDQAAAVARMLNSNRGQCPTIVLERAKMELSSEELE